MSASPAPIEDPVKYGELIVLGSNDFLSYEARMRRHFTLFQKRTANGLKPSTVHCNPQASLSIMDQHAVSYKHSAVSTTVVAYAPDQNSDMFQIGRSPKTPNNFVVTDTVADGQTSPISRFACRIVCQRRAPYAARIYAAGFDCSKKIFLGENANKWRTRDGQMDGLTTNGVLVMRPPLSQDAPPLWREISVCGNVFPLQCRGQGEMDMVTGESHELVDGSMINLSGVTLLWRTAEGLARTPIMEHLEIQRAPELYVGIPCFVFKFREDGVQQDGVQQDGAGMLNDPQRAELAPPPAAAQAPRKAPSASGSSSKRALPPSLQEEIAMGIKLIPVKVLPPVIPPEVDVLPQCFENMKIPFIPVVRDIHGDKGGHADYENDEWNS